ncbi:PP2C family protein-serine/threonine phosphatase [Actinoallomurus sp. CA-150999]|uniref:PP2C family protein-serine/threonine phosphatase n=1 Tax=Actinoallomurus sp. CA-150999 TaxID=3239887 RepID=UPI003D941E68
MNSRKVRFSRAAFSESGAQRDDNEDAAYAGPYLLAVADGFASAFNERMASAVAIEALRALDSQASGKDITALKRGVNNAHDWLVALGKYDKDWAPCGTTLTSVLLSEDAISVSHIGDSRAYLFRNGRLSLLTQDHTLANKLISEGEMTAEEAEKGGYDRMLMRVLDCSRALEADFFQLEAQLGDRYLLCTDGVWKVLSFDRLELLLAQGSRPGEVARELAEQALEKEYFDNISCVVADIVLSDESEVPETPIVAGATPPIAELDELAALGRITR